MRNSLSFVLIFTWLLAAFPSWTSSDETTVLVIKREEQPISQITLSKEQLELMMLRLKNAECTDGCLSMLKSCACEAVSHEHRADFDEGCISRSFPFLQVLGSDVFFILAGYLIDQAVMTNNPGAIAANIVSSCILVVVGMALQAPHVKKLFASPGQLSLRNPLDVFIERMNAATFNSEPIVSIVPSGDTYTFSVLSQSFYDAMRQVLREDNYKSESFRRAITPDELD